MLASRAISQVDREIEAQEADDSRAAGRSGAGAHERKRGSGVRSRRSRLPAGELYRSAQRAADGLAGDRERFGPGASGGDDRRAYGVAVWAEQSGGVEA